MTREENRLACSRIYAKDHLYSNDSIVKKNPSKSTFNLLLQPWSFWWQKKKKCEGKKSRNTVESYISGAKFVSSSRKLSYSRRLPFEFSASGTVVKQWSSGKVKMPSLSVIVPGTFKWLGGDYKKMSTKIYNRILYTIVHTLRSKKVTKKRKGKKRLTFSIYRLRRG